MGLLCSWWALVLVRVPIPLDPELQPALVTSTVAGSGIPPTSNARSPQHFAFVRSATPLADGVQLDVYAIVSFSSSGGAVNGYNNLTEERKATLIPLSHSMPTPELFGEPLTIGGWINSWDARLLVVPTTFIMPASRRVSVLLSYPCAICCHPELPDTVQKAHSPRHDEPSGIESSRTLS
jgi:hypothetical protein